MRFYRVDYKVSEETALSREWFTSRREAEKCARQNEYGDYSSHVTDVEVPTDRAGLLAFLRENLWQNPSWEAP